MNEIAIEQNRVLKKMLPSEGFNYFSGADGNATGYFPCMYSYYDEGSVWVVIGPPNIQIETRSFREAVREYKKHFVGKSATEVALMIRTGKAMCNCH